MPAPMPRSSPCPCWAMPGPTPPRWSRATPWPSSTPRVPRACPRACAARTRSTTGGAAIPANCWVCAMPTCCSPPCRCFIPTRSTPFFRRCSPAPRWWCKSAFRPPTSGRRWCATRPPSPTCWAPWCPSCCRASHRPPTARTACASPWRRPFPRAFTTPSASALAWLCSTATARPRAISSSAWMPSKSPAAWAAWCRAFRPAWPTTSTMNCPTARRASCCCAPTNPMPSPPATSACPTRRWRPGATCGSTRATGWCATPTASTPFSTA